MEYFILDGIKSSDFGVEIVNTGNSLTQNFLPPKNTTTERITGYDGNRFITQDRTPKRIPLSLSISDVSQSNQNKISRWLGKKGEFKLTLSYQPQKVYTVTIEASTDIQSHVNGGRMEITFIAYYPLAKSKFSTLDIINDNLNYDASYYYNSGLLYDEELAQYEFNGITTTTNMDIYNGSNVSGSRPNIIIDGVADDITIYQYEDENRTVLKDYITYGNFDGIVEVDCLKQQTYYNGSVANATFSGKYFELDTDLINLGSGQVVDYSNNTITLDNNASSSSGQYVGEYISVGKSYDKSWYKIIAYDGGTKVATIDGSINDDIVDNDYGIYNIVDGMNYFTIEGTNMNINSIKWDFKFLYN